MEDIVSKYLLRNRNFILFLALALGLLWGEGGRWTKPLVLPALAIVMTVSTLGVSGSVFRSLRGLLLPALTGIVMNYGILGGLLIGLNSLLIREEDIRTGFFLIAAAPPGVAVIPFTGFLNGDSTFSLIGTIGGYLGALIIMPLIALWFIGTSFVQPFKLLIIMVELILVPLILSRILLRTSISTWIEPIKGAVTNWGFFIVIYTIVGLNSEIFLKQPLSLVPVFALTFASTFLLGWVIEKMAQFFRVDPKKAISLVLLGTIKNYGIAGGIALTLFSEQTAVPASVSVIFIVLYFIGLDFKKR